MLSLSRLLIDLRVWSHFGVALLIALIDVAAIRANDPELSELPQFFSIHCIRCHNAELHEADFQLDRVTMDSEATEFGPLWSRALERINSGELIVANKTYYNSQADYIQCRYLTDVFQSLQKPPKSALMNV